MGELDNPKFFCGDHEFTIRDEFGLTECFVDSIIVNGVDYIGFLGALLYYVIQLRKYHNFNGQRNRFQKGSAQILIFVKFVVSFIIAFEWAFWRLDASRLHNYPMFMTIADTFHLIVWFTVSTVTYLEWNRSLPHSMFLRGWWGASLLVNVWKFYTIASRQGIDTESTFKQAILSSGIVLACHSVITLFGIVGLVPKVQPYLEADVKLAQRKKGVSGETGPESDAKLFFRSVVTKASVPFLVAGFILTCVRGWLMQLIMTFIGNVVSKTSQSTTVDPIIMAILQLVGVVFGYAIAFGVAYIFWGIGAERVVNGPNGLRVKLFKNVLRQEVAYYAQVSTGVLVSRFSNDAERVKRTLTEFFPTLFEFLSMVIVGLFYLFQTSWTIALYLVTIVPLAYAVSYYQGEMFQLFEERSQARTARMTAKVQDVFSKYPTVLIYNTKNTEKKLMWQLVRHNYKVLRSKAIFSGVIVSISEFLSWCTVLLGVFLGVSLLSSFASNAGEGDDKVGLFTTFALYSMNVIRAMIQILKTLPRIGETLGGVAEVLRMIDREPRAPEGSGTDDDDKSGDKKKKRKNQLALSSAPRSRSISMFTATQLPNIRCSTGEIEFRNVVFSYPTAPDRVALNGINLKVPRNSKVALIGDSGAGKSTILQLIARFYDPSSGSVLLDGQDLRDYNTSSIRSHMAIVSQESDIFSLSIFENLIYGRNIEDEAGGLELVDEALDSLRTGQRLSARAQKLVDDVLDAAEKAHALDFVEGRLTEVLGEGGKGLSGGQKQRLAIARALFKNPKILLLDEVTSALDSVSEAAVQKAIDTLTQNRTVFIVAHRLHTIQNADKIVVLSGGKIVAEGKHDDLMKSSDKYRELVEAAVQSGGNVAAVKKAAAPSTVSDEVPQEMVQLFRRVKHEFGHFDALRDEFFPRIHAICPELAPKPQYISDSDASTIELSGIADRDLDAEDETEAPVRPTVHPRFRRPEFGSVRDYYELIDDETDDDESALDARRIN